MELLQRLQPIDILFVIVWAGVVGWGLQTGIIRQLGMLVGVYGAKRIMWSSNYPAHPRFGDIKPRLESSKQALSTLSAEDQAWILGKTALSFYPALA